MGRPITHTHTHTPEIIHRLCEPGWVGDGHHREGTVILRNRGQVGPEGGLEVDGVHRGKRGCGEGSAAGLCKKQSLKFG
jgi:hypothetical protein